MSISTVSKHKTTKVFLLIFVVLSVLFCFSISSPLFKSNYATLLLDSEGKLLSARIASDGQWRFPQPDSIPDKFKKAIVAYEDKRFFFHQGIDPLSFARAIIQNIKAKRYVSGGSTISMQVIRLSQNIKKRSIPVKIYEMLLALRLELTYSKQEILNLYASHAPYGSNIVGIEAASWRYYGVSPSNLSWGAIATLAVLPNSPSIIYPGKNQEKLLLKRNRLLDKLFKNKTIDNTTLILAKTEPLPLKPYALPDLAPHLLDYAVNDGKKGSRILSSVSFNLQEKVSEIIENHHRKLEGNEIHNAAALVVEVSTGKVLAYIGNTKSSKGNEHNNYVDVANSPRSTGSILKPFLFAGMLNEGMLLPSTLVADIPTQISGFTPQNYSMEYDGAVPAYRALARSLNVPAVRMLQSYGVEQYYILLKKLGMTTLAKPSSHYGLSLILGGAEAKLWDLAGIYASLARTLNHYTLYNGKYDKEDYSPTTYEGKSKQNKKPKLENSSYLNAASIWFMLQAMIEVVRPDEELQWQLFNSSERIAWKTGTSYGNRDAWSIGITPRYVVAVWVGNADGEGRPGLVGIEVAAPILFDIFKTLPKGAWFSKPFDDMIKIPICIYSGYRASSICEYIDSVWVPIKGLKTGVCPYHRIVHLDSTERWQVNSNCESINNMHHKAWFVLPPAQEWFFKTKNPFYKSLPPYRDDCTNEGGEKTMELIYPQNGSKIFIPIELDGKAGRTIFRAAHHNNNAVLYWHIDNEFVCKTQNFHEIAVAPSKGKHKLTIVDDKGESIVCYFEVVHSPK